MIRPPGFGGVGFGDASDGDLLGDDGSRALFSRTVGIGTDWAWLRQVHGASVCRAVGPGIQGEADAVFTTEPGLPIAVATADCYPVVVEGNGGVGIAHAGWRGAAAGVVPALLGAMRSHGVEPLRAAVGPGIGPCCFEVGPEVAARFPSRESMTSWGTPSVDLEAAVVSALAGLEVWVSGICTMSDHGYHSHRRDATRSRQAAVTWLPV
jgi:YfiH family protein